MSSEKSLYGLVTMLSLYFIFIVSEVNLIGQLFTCLQYRHH